MILFDKKFKQKMAYLAGIVADIDAKKAQALALCASEAEKSTREETKLLLATKPNLKKIGYYIGRREAYGEIKNRIVENIWD